MIVGASVAGPALAIGLEAAGWAVTVVERAPELRKGGQAVDFKGEVHRTVLGRMGVADAVRARQTGKTDARIVDAHDRVLATIPGEFIGGDVEILRGDLSEILVARTAATYRFDDTVTALAEDADGVAVAFEKAAPERFDLVFGADGIHSAVRRLAFGPEAEFVRHNGYYYAVAGAAEASPERAVGFLYGEPGRTVVAGGPKAPSMFVFAADPIDYDRRDVDAQKRIVRERFAGMGWRTAALVEDACAADEFYLDALARVRMDGYTRGRVALVGDAGYGNTLGGFGTGLALVGAYVLAGELAAADGDHAVAFARYDRLVHRYARIARSGNAGPFLAPRTAAGARLRNAMFRLGPLLRLTMALTDRFATRIDLPDYRSSTRRSVRS